MKNYKITINGKTYDVGVEDAGGAPEIKSVQVAAPAAPKAAPAPAPAPAPKAAAPAAPAPKAAAGGDVLSPLAGTVLSVAVSEGQAVKAGQVLVVFEAMKMENEITAPKAGTVQKIHVAKGTVLETGTPVVTLA